MSQASRIRTRSLSQLSMRGSTQENLRRAPVVSFKHDFKKVINNTEKLFREGTSVKRLLAEVKVMKSHTDYLFGKGSSLLVLL